MKHILVDFISKHITSDIETRSLTQPAVCAFTGAALETGEPVVHLKSVIKSATANLGDTFRYGSEFVMPAVAACFGESRLLRGNLFISDAGIIAPMVSGKSALKAKRPTWTEIIQNRLDGSPAVFILTEESKRRLWLDAWVSETENKIKVFLNEGNTCQLITVQKNKLHISLELVLSCLRHQFSKQAIRTSLYRHKVGLSTAGLKTARQLETACQQYRGTPEFQVATFIGTIEGETD